VKTARLYPNGLRPPLKWAGGKRWLVPHLKEIWTKHSSRRLVEPLCGGLAVTLGLLPERALLNDINPHLINFFLQIQSGLYIDLPMENDQEQYYAHRHRFNALAGKSNANTAEAAGLFYYLNRTGYNGLCRFNRSGEYNVPFGSYGKINYTRNFLPYRELFRSWIFESVDFGQIKLETDDFVYADPPYDVDFTHYSKGGFNWDDQVRLANWLAGHPGPVVLSNQATERIISLYSQLNYKLIFLNGPRLISCKGERSPAREVLALKNL
jgi:DNA adenine methylase